MNECYSNLPSSSGDIMYAAFENCSKACADSFAARERSTNLVPKTTISSSALSVSCSGILLSSHHSGSHDPPSLSGKKYMSGILAPRTTLRKGES